MMFKYIYGHNRASDNFVHHYSSVKQPVYKQDGDGDIVYIYLPCLVDLQMVAMGTHPLQLVILNYLLDCSSGHLMSP